MLTEIYRETKNVTPSKRPRKSHPLADTAHAFGKSTQAIKDVDSRYIDRDLDHKRKRRSDAVNNL